LTPSACYPHLCCLLCSLHTTSHHLCHISSPPQPSHWLYHLLSLLLHQPPAIPSPTTNHIFITHPHSFWQPLFFLLSSNANNTFHKKSSPEHQLGPCHQSSHHPCSLVAHELCLLQIIGWSLILEQGKNHYRWIYLVYIKHWIWHGWACQGIQKGVKDRQHSLAVKRILEFWTGSWYPSFLSEMMFFFFFILFFYTCSCQCSSRVPWFSRSLLQTMLTVSVLGPCLWCQCIWWLFVLVSPKFTDHPLQTLLFFKHSSASISAFNLVGSWMNCYNNGIHADLRIKHCRPISPSSKHKDTLALCTLALCMCCWTALCHQLTCQPCSPCCCFLNTCPHCSCS
jgi:hypothetical protein